MTTPLGPVVCDTSGLLALADAADPDHEAVAAFVDAAIGPFVVSPLVVAETDYLLRARCGAEAARVFADDVGSGAYRLAAVTPADIAECVALDRQYADLGLGLTDAHLVVIAAAYRTELILSLDERHLRAVRPLRAADAFRLLPSDC